MRVTITVPGASFLRPKRTDWFNATLALAVVSIAVFIGATWWAPWKPGRIGGLTFGTLAAIIFLLDALYPLRRRLLAWPLGTAQRWLQFHIYGGFLACLFVLIHVGFAWPTGQFGWWLFILTLWSTVSGLVGVYLQKWVPTLMSANLSVEALFDRIPEMTSRLQAEADEAVRGASDVLERFYLSNVRPMLAGVSPSWSYLVDIRSGRERQAVQFRNMAPFVVDAERGKLDDLQAIVAEKMELDAHYSLQRALRMWLLLHVPPALILVGLVAAHVLFVWYL
jgi:hypothetical protein